MRENCKMFISETLAYIDLSVKTYQTRTFENNPWIPNGKCFTPDSIGFVNLQVRYLWQLNENVGIKIILDIYGQYRPPRNGSYHNGYFGNRHEDMLKP